jgi:hypothetical protein
MNAANFRQWNILCWNARGLNSEAKWDAIKHKVLQPACDIISFLGNKEGNH